MRLITALLSFLLLFVTSSAAASTYNFGDTHNYWPGWNNGTGDDSEDTIGIPNLTGGTLTTDATNNLSGITINYSEDPSNHWADLVPGDLFIDLNADQTWDIVIGLQTVNAGEVNVFDFQGAVIPFASATAYELSNDSDMRGGGSWAGENIRERHPWALAPVAATNGYPVAGTATYSGWTDPVTFPFSLSFSLTNIDINGLPIALGENGFDLIIGFTVNCANDVIYERVTGGPIPEPATVVLLGCALLGIFTRRHAKN